MDQTSSSGKADIGGEDVLNRAFFYVAKNLRECFVVQDFVSGEQGSYANGKGNKPVPDFLKPNFQEFDLNILLRQALLDSIDHYSHGESRFKMKGERLVTHKNDQRYVDIYLEDAEKKECYIVELKYHSVTYLLENPRKLKEEERKNGAEWSDKQKSLIGINPKTLDYWNRNIVQKRKILEDNLSGWNANFDSLIKDNSETKMVEVLSSYSARIFTKGGAISDNSIVSLQEYLNSERPNSLRISFLEQVAQQARYLALEKGSEYKIIPMILIGLYNILFLFKITPDYQYSEMHLLLRDPILNPKSFDLGKKAFAYLKCSTCKNECSKQEKGTLLPFCNEECQLKYSPHTQ
jgi:hypothetical protein